MEEALRYTAYTAYTVYSIQAALHCRNSRIYACIAKDCLLVKSRLALRSSSWLVGWVSPCRKWPNTHKWLLSAPYDRSRPKVKLFSRPNQTRNEE